MQSSDHTITQLLLKDAMTEGVDHALRAQLKHQDQMLAKFDEQLESCRTELKELQQLKRELNRELKKNHAELKNLRREVKQTSERLHVHHLALSASHQERVERESLAQWESLSDESKLRRLREYEAYERQTCMVIAGLVSAMLIYIYLTQSVVLIIIYAASLAALSQVSETRDLYERCSRGVTYGLIYLIGSWSVTGLLTHLLPSALHIEALGFILSLGCVALAAYREYTYYDDTVHRLEYWVKSYLRHSW